MRSDNQRHFTAAGNPVKMIHHPCMVVGNADDRIRTVLQQPDQLIFLYCIV